jgi:hypothetical protein
MTAPFIAIAASFVATDRFLRAPRFTMARDSLDDYDNAAR